jgi:hypothetical protein
VVHPTPWKKRKDLQGQIGHPSSTAPRTSQSRIDAAKVVTSLRPHLHKLSGHWGYLFAALGNCIVFSILFEPWVDAKALDGKIKATPFGKLQISSSLVSLWSGSPPAQVKVTGTWAVLATVTVIVTVFAVTVNIWARTEILARLSTGSSIATALLIVVTLVHMNGKAPELRSMLGYGNPRDLGSQIGMIVRWATGNGRYPMPGARQVTWTTASLTAWAWFATVVAIASALAAIAQWVRNQPAGSIRMSLRR